MLIKEHYVSFEITDLLIMNYYKRNKRKQTIEVFWVINGMNLEYIQILISRNTISKLRQNNPVIFAHKIVTYPS